MRIGHLQCHRGSYPWQVLSLSGKCPSLGPSVAALLFGTDLWLEPKRAMPDQGNQQMNKECDQIINFIKVKGCKRSVRVIIHVHSILVHELGVNYCLPFHQRRGWRHKRHTNHQRKRQPKKKVLRFPTQATDVDNCKQPSKRFTSWKPQWEAKVVNTCTPKLQNLGTALLWETHGSTMFPEMSLFARTPWNGKEQTENGPKVGKAKASSAFADVDLATRKMDGDFECQGKHS